MNFITLKPISLVNGSINLPGSKSISNRALLLSAMAKGTTKLLNLLDSDDVYYMLNALNKLGVNYELSNKKTYCQIEGVGGCLSYNNKLEIFLGNAGTVMRFLTAALSVYSNNIVLTGIKRMKKRPIGDLVDSLKKSGAKIEYLNKKNYPPILLKGGFIGGDIHINGSISSQFISALLMISPFAIKDVTIIINNKVVSKSYIDITIALMRIYGVFVINKNYKYFFIKSKQQYKSPGEYLIEGDASSASYFLAAGAIKGGVVRVIGVGKKSIQGDIEFANILKKMGAIIHWHDNYIECKRFTLKGININMNSIPDTAMTIAIVALFAKGKTIIKDIYNWRIKETDRIFAMTNELRKIGATIKEGYDYIEISPPKKFNYAKIKTYNDHRIAMCFSLIALSKIPVTILNCNCITKTFPYYFNQLKSISHKNFFN
ncbi:3-phosphoshikimate 1-carboxyvinyltransferase [Candidatus Providencia siddallii]|uniref:3-phosphoshikimate 1-carboxyvinyltransferase n=1 Tax=Candidatus Providencia siddallii TaxID=1715285 RepID=A0A0M6W9M4_9GAMM|nr:3-phosphoshikimate 1-carboxyvinyltransferase [Candidatus Providencia siddallii]